MKSEQMRYRILAADLLWIPAAAITEPFLCPIFFGQKITTAPFNFLVHVITAVFFWILLSENLHLDGFREGWRLPSVIARLLLGVALLKLLLLATDTVTAQYVGTVPFGKFSVGLLLAGFLAIRRGALWIVLRRYRRGDFSRAVILGSDRLATELAAKLDHHPELLCKVVGFLRPKTEFATADRDLAASLLTLCTLEVTELLRLHKVDELILACSSASNEILNLVSLCRQRNIRVSLVPQPYELYLSRPTLIDLEGLPLLQLGEMAPAASARIGKRALDIGLGLVLTFLALPVILVCGTALRFLTGRAFRWEVRTGWQGEQFRMLRLNVGRDAQPSARFQWFVWQLSLSELPQLWNVLRGEMSLVGPRPEGPERANRYSSWQKKRLAVKPGMTGLAQVQGLREQHGSEEKTSHDLQYMLSPTFGKDLILLVETIWTLMVRLARLPALASEVASGEALKASSRLVCYPAGSQSLTEMLQNAHRTQSGSD